MEINDFNNKDNTQTTRLRDKNRRKFDSTHKNFEHSTEYADKKKVNIWPYEGTCATDILQNNYNVMVATDILTTVGFVNFYKEWIHNTALNGGKRIFTLAAEIENAKIISAYSEIQILQFGNCNDYISFFPYIKGTGNWLFLTEDIKKAENVIEASRKAGVYLRIYGLDKDGKLKNYKPSVKKEEYRTKTKSCIDAFLLPSKLAPIREIRRSDESIPIKGDVVYTSNNQLIRLGDEFLSNPQSITYQTDLEGMQAKIYQASWLTVSYFEDKAKKMLEKPIRYEGICWPTDLLRNEKGHFIGILVPETKGYQLKQQLMSQQGLETNFPDWDRRKLTHLVKVILDKIIYLQERNILFGLVNPSAIFVKDENHVYFAEMDTYQIEGYPILSYERVMQAPELQDDNEGMRLYDKQEDNYEIALLTFMLLLPGKFPYNKGKNKNITESIKNMNFAFRYGKQGEEHGAREYFGSWRFVWSHLGNDLKQAFYFTFQHGQAYSIPEKRKDARFWQKKVSELERELVDPYDKESLRIFPRTFKRFSGTKTIRCVKCGIDHPDFYYRYPERKICNSCLGQPSETYFVCRSCNKSFYYDFGTLFKYEKLVETKDFSMPTHCPYCRSDKIKCKICRKFVPAYRINNQGICFDCAKAEREKIVKRYSCKCGREIIITQGQYDYHMNKYGRLPQRCEQCRESRHNRY